MSERIERLVGDMTLDEKAAFVAGADLWHTPGVERLGVPPLKVTDGPGGARGEKWTGHAAASFPCGTALGATWDPALVEQVGARIGNEAKRRHAQLLLAPTVNTHRHPLAGRNFECYSEDPHLSARAAVAYITGVQSQGVGCSVKHLVANDSEFERMTISSEVDERTLREISLVPFEAAVRDAGAWSVMTAYNRLHGTYCSEHDWLVGDLLKGEWGFDGMVISDWFGTHSTAPAANAGLDLEMPGPPQHFGPKLADAVRAGEVDEKTLDDKVRRILTLLDRAGALDAPGGEPEESIDDPQDRAVARAAAAASFVLLRNRGDALPLGPDVQTIAVIGPNADVAMIQGGGSARVSPHEPVTPLAGLRARFADATVEHARGCSSYKQTPPIDARTIDGALHVEYFGGREREGDVLLVEETKLGYFTFLGAVAPGVPDDFSLRVTGTIVAPETGEWTLTLVQAGRARLSLDGALLVDNWDPTGHSDAFFGFGSDEVAATVELTAGEAHALEVEFVPAGPALGGLAIGCMPPSPPDLLERAVEVAARADAVVLVVGTDGDWETEGHDRESMALPPPQDELVRAIAAANGRTVVVVNTASPVSMPWLDDVSAVLQGWFAGEEWGNALADVLSGDQSPSGKLPTTIPVRIEDTPAFTSYPGERGHVRYGEGVFVGYRWYDTRRIEPRFSFGHGLSYTTFALGDATWDGDEVRVTVTNTGTRRGAEVVQVYVHDAEASVARPDQELKAFRKVWLDPGASATVSLPLDDRAFAFWDVDRHEWLVEAGDFELRIGTSSRDIRHRLRINIEGSKAGTREGTRA
jgi:beta-glucosidase